MGKLIMQPLSFLIPWKYKPIPASTVASKIRELITAAGEGTSTWEGKALFNKN